MEDCKQQAQDAWFRDFRRKEMTLRTKLVTPFLERKSGPIGVCTDPALDQQSRPVAWQTRKDGEWAAAGVTNPTLDLAWGFLSGERHGVVFMSALLYEVGNRKFEHGDFAPSKSLSYELLKERPWHPNSKEILPVYVYTPYQTSIAGLLVRAAAAYELMRMQWRVLVGPKHFEWMQRHRE